MPRRGPARHVGEQRLPGLVGQEGDARALPAPARRILHRQRLGFDIRHQTALGVQRPDVAQAQPQQLSPVQAAPDEGQQDQALGALHLAVVGERWGRGPAG